ncbi:MAG: hypothetical protein ACK52I_12920 [Pseudomonadota bacterium]
MPLGESVWDDTAVTLPHARGPVGCDRSPAHHERVDAGHGCPRYREDVSDRERPPAVNRVQRLGARAAGPEKLP